MHFPHIRARRVRAAGLLIALAGLLAALPPGEPATLADTGGPPIPARGPVHVSSSADAVAGRIAPALRQAAAEAPQSDTLLPVIVVSQGAAPAGLLQHPVARRPDPHGLVFTSGQARAGQIAALATPGNVVAVLSGAPPPIPTPPDLDTPAPGRPDQRQRAVSSEPRAATKDEEREPSSPDLAQHATGNTPPIQNLKLKNIPSSPLRDQNSAAAPESWHTVDIQDVRPAWAAGYRGEGVKVAVVDSGVDFGHPDLLGTFARVADPASPYYGWPLAFDPTSMGLLAGGIVGDATNAIRAYGSWYIDTRRVIQGETGRFTTVSASPSGAAPITQTYQMPGTSKSGVYHIGIFPDEHLAFDVYGQYPVVVVADTMTPGVYDTVYVDLRNTRDLRQAVALRKGHEVESVDTTGDGVPDLSTGLLYFIADGQHPVPASDWMYGLSAPDNGGLVAMMGSYDYNEHHGTACASSIVAQGVIDGDHDGLRPPYKPAGVGGMVQGMAPGAKIIAIGNVYRFGPAIYDAYSLVTYGLDGRPHTGDEPQIASLSFGFSGGVDSGWDFQARYLAWLQAENPHLSYVAATGNGGPGYGTMTSPAAAPNVIAVGAATQYGETTTFEPISTTQEITWGDIQPWSNRGPSVLGNAGPQVVAVGAWGTADDALNYSRNGAIAYNLWGGTSMATPITAGVLALGYQAYHQATGQWPAAGTARELLTSAARDLHYGVFTQGAGLVDGKRLVDLAAGRAGLQVSPARWTPGQVAPAFAGYLRPGEPATTTLTLTNPTGAPLTATLAGDRLVEIGHFDWTVVTSNTLESEGDFRRPDYLRDLTGAIPTGTDLMKVQAVISYTDFTNSAPTSTWLFWRSTWRLLAYDWRDKNGDRRAWTDANRNGVVNDDEMQTGEYNRLWYAYGKSDILEGFVANPLERVHDGLLIGLQHADVGDDIPTTRIRLRAVFYRHTPWSPLTLDPATVVVPARGSARVTARMQVPAAQAPGAYEGAIRVRSGGQASLVPVALNVALPQLLGTFGGMPAQPTTYNSGRVSGALDWSWRPEAGEWRHLFAFNPAAPPPNTYLWVNTTWPHYPNDLDTFLLGAAPWDYYSVTQPGLFGPYALWGMGGSAYNFLGGGMWQWATNTNGPAEWVSAPLGQPGLHEIVLHNDWYSGADFSEPYTGTLGTVRLSTGAIALDSNRARDSTTFTVTTGMTLSTGLAASGYGLSQRSILHDLPIQAQGTYFYEITLSDTASVEFSTGSPRQIDLYMYLDYWSGNRWEWLAASGGGSPNQYIRLEPVHDGRYRLRIDGGLQIPEGGSTFDLTIKAVRGNDLSVRPARVPGPIGPGTTLTFTVSYDRPDLLPGLYDGKVFVGPREAPALVALPVSLRYGNPPPEPTPTSWPCVADIRDMSPADWAWPYVQYLYCHGIAVGYLDRTFHPNERTNRVQFLAMLGRAQGWGLLTPDEPTFHDVPPTFWGYSYIETAAHQGLVSGYDDGTFRPVALVSRAQVAKILGEAAGWPTTPPAHGPRFSDVPRAHWAYGYVTQAAAHGILGGYADGTFHPGAAATRAQIARMLYQLLHQ